MNPTIKNQWITALKSGNYKKTTGALKRGDCFCALGVLCDIFSKEKNIPWDKSEEDYRTTDDFGAIGYILGKSNDLPVQVKDWAKIPHDKKRDIEKIDWLITLNDKVGFSFSDIATHINAQF